VLSAGWWWFYDGFAVLTERPDTILLDDRDRLHGESGPAITYPDGWSVNALGGTALPSWFREPGAITSRHIMVERNLEVRRHLIGQFGAELFMTEENGELRDASEWGELWCCRSGPPWRRMPWFAMVHVIDATPQPDGTRRDYWISVPPETRTAHEAVAWTFGLDAESYDPALET
jgi:hypothetical protein